MRFFKNIFINAGSCSFYNLLLFSLGNLLLATLPLLQTLVCARIVDALLNNDSNSFSSRLLLVVCLFLLIRLTSIMVNEFLKYIKNKLKYKIRIFITNKLITKISLIKYENIEKDTNQELLMRLFDKGEDKYISIIQNITIILRETISVLFISLLIISKDFISGLILFLLDIPIILFSYKSGTAMYSSNVSATKNRLMLKYIDTLFLERGAFYERMLFDATENWNQKWNKEHTLVRKKEMQGFLKYFLKIRIGVLVGIVCICLVFALLVIPLMEGKLSTGEYIALAGNIIFVFQYQSNSFPFCFSEIIKNIFYQKEFEQFMDQEIDDKTANSKIDMANTNISFENVSFNYPNSNNDTIHDVSFVLEKGKSYAFVGSNGAGKTTLIKLMLGLYSEYKGSIKIGNNEVKSCSYEDLGKLFGIIFQDYSKYALSIKDNIIVGRNFSQKELDSVKNILGFSNDFKVNDETILGKVGNSQNDLSLGQWQMIALARAIINGSKIIVFDEPTAALDPNMEFEFFSNIKGIIKDKTSILISHRLASVKFVDRIFVIDNGIVAEEGSHDELIAKRGLYYEMYNQQRSWYDY